MTYLNVLTLLHTLISLVAIGAGAVAIVGLIRNTGVDVWTRVFLATAVLTSASGYLFPFGGVTPGIVVGVIALAILALVLVAFYKFNAAGAWRWIYAAGMVASLYLLVFVGVAQAFQKIAYLNGLAPTQSEPPFLAAQAATLLFFVILGVVAARGYRPRMA